LAKALSSERINDDLISFAYSDMKTFHFGAEMKRKYRLEAKRSEKIEAKGSEMRRKNWQFVFA
jgi:hypothetical protein